ncbi:MAG: monovalent cation/H(+) antiporter subunit G [Proteobacteria bacterium]|nr:monovalent cation/H(+) antiporter subunit G [Pseudomonadota bacterium]
MKERHWISLQFFLYLFYSRMHATGKCDTLGAFLLLAGLAILNGVSLASMKILFILVFIFSPPFCPPGSRRWPAYGRFSVYWKLPGGSFCRGLFLSFHLLGDHGPYLSLPNLVSKRKGIPKCRIPVLTHACLGRLLLVDRGPSSLQHLWDPGRWCFG